MWKARLQDNYASYREWETYSDTYGLAGRLGYTTSAEAWAANPMVQGSANPKDFRLVLDEFTTAYVTAALWASTDETNPEQGGEPLDSNYDLDDIEPETLAQMVEDCRQFQDKNTELINDENVAVESDHSCDARAGHDFWLTRNGHGAGFWDGDWKEPAATKLTDAAKKAGEYNITASGNGGLVTTL